MTRRRSSAVEGGRTAATAEHGNIRVGMPSCRALFVRRGAAISLFEMRQSESPAVVLAGRHVRLEPLAMQHAGALAAAVAASDGELYRWTTVPRSVAEAETYIGQALQWQKDGTAVPFVITRASDGEVIG